MQEQTLDFVTPIQFKQIILIPIKVNLEKLFGENQIKFQISIKDNKLIIESPKILASLDFQDNIPPEEAINVKYHSETL
jgi:hypothetical protein